MNPHRDILRRKALLAAASVVLALGTVACDPSLLTNDDTKSDTADTALDSAVAEADEDCMGLSSEATTTCCNARAVSCDVEFGADTEASDFCTYGPDYDGSTGCIPWGPPAPPVFRGAVA